MEFTDPHGVRRHTRGVIGALTLPEPGDDDVLPHERTLPKAKSDRLALLRAMRVNVDPIWGLTLGSGLTALLATATPLVQCLDPDGVFHEIAAIDNPKTVAAIQNVVASAPLVLADGHHRFETAINYRNELRARDEPAGAAAIMTFVVELVDDELCIEPIHRLVDAPPGTDVRAARRRVRRCATPAPTPPTASTRSRSRCATSTGSGSSTPAASRSQSRSPTPAPPWRSTSTRPSPAPTPRSSRRSSSPGSPTRPGSTATTPAGWPRSSTRVRPPPRSSARRSRSPRRAAAVDRVRMPQKTTFFWPKPRTGMVFRTLATTGPSSTAY